MRNHDREHAPLNSGSKTRPERFNMRLTTECYARLIKVFNGIADNAGMSDYCFADVVEEQVLPALEHLLRSVRWGSPDERDFANSFFRPLQKSDYLVERGKRLIREGVIKRFHFEQIELPL